MTEQEQSECSAASVALNGISVFGVIIFLTIPSVLLLSKYCFLFENIAILVFIFSGLLVGFRAWHLQFDAKLLHQVAIKNLDLKDLDFIIFKLFNKKTGNRSLEARISSCYKLATGFLILIKIHLVFYLVLMAWILIFKYS
ncbi:MAG TPA: hypothetical protein VF677_01635 [Flavobacterium sp.]|jgi:hypothetical protein